MKRKFINLSVWIIVLIIIMSALAACDSIQIGKEEPTALPPALSDPIQESKVIAEGHLEPKEFRYLNFSTPGTLGEVLVDEGDFVKKGQLLARVDGIEEIEARLNAATLDVESAKYALEELKRTALLSHTQALTNLTLAEQKVVQSQKIWNEIDTQDTRDKIEDARTEVADAEIGYRNAKEDFEPYEDLPEDNSQRKLAKDTLDEAEKTYRNAISKRDELITTYQLAEANVNLAIVERDEAEYLVDQTNDGPDPDQLKLAELRLQSAETALLAVTSAMDNLAIKAPFDSEIIEIRKVEGDQVNPSEWLILLADTSQWFLRTSDLTELEVVKIEPGQKVSLKSDALPDLIMNGTVDTISQTSHIQTGDIVFDTLIRIDDLDPRLRWGMTMEAIFADK